MTEKTTESEQSKVKPLYEMVTPEIVERVAQEAERQMKDELAKVSSGHNIKNMKSVIHSATDLLGRIEPARALGVFNQEMGKQMYLVRHPVTPGEAEAMLVGLHYIAHTLELPIDMTQLDRIVEKLAEEARIRAEKLARSKDIKFDLTNLIPQLLPDENAPIKPVLRTRVYTRSYYEQVLHSWQKTSHKQLTDAQVQSRVGTFNMVTRMLGERIRDAYSADQASAIPYFEMVMDDICNVHQIKTAMEDTQEPRVADFIDQFKRQIKYSIIGAHPPEDVQEAMKEAIEKTIDPVISGKLSGTHFHVSKSIDQRLVRNLKLGLIHEAMNFKEKYDVTRYFTQSTSSKDHPCYMNTTGGLRTLANETLRVFYERLGEKCPELSTAYTYTPTRPYGKDGLPLETFRPDPENSAGRGK